MNSDSELLIKVDVFTACDSVYDRSDKLNTRHCHESDYNNN